MGCYRCLNPEHRCRVNDDLYFILEKMQAFGGIIFSIPTYVLGPVGQFKLFADRLACMAVFHPAFQKIHAVTAVFGGIEGWRGVTQSLVNAVVRMMGFNLKGSAFIEAALPGECLDSKYQPVAQGLANVLSSSAETYFPCKTLQCPACGSDLFLSKASVWSAPCAKVQANTGMAYGLPIRTRVGSRPKVLSNTLRAGLNPRFWNMYPKGTSSFVA